MRELCSGFFSDHLGLRLAVIASRDNAAALDLQPYGVGAELYEPEKSRELVEQYLRLNHCAFRSLPLPRWVLSDLYLLPGAIGLILGPAALMEEQAREAARVGPSATAILAAYVAAPSVVAGRFIGVSLIGFARGVGAAAFVKVLTLKMLGAKAVRGVTQWDNGSLKVHTRLGPLRVVGPAPGGHELGGQSFVYECDLSDPEKLRQAMTRTLPERPVCRVPSSDGARLSAVVQGALRGEQHLVLPPGLDAEGRVVLAA